VLGACNSDAPSSSDLPATTLDSLPPVGSASAPDRGAPGRRVRSQTLYVPAYSHIYIRDARRSMNLATTLSIRNTSPNDTITLSTIDYYDSEGQPVRSYLDRPRQLGPLASTHAVVDVDDLRGGVGANFIVRWHASTPVPPPIVETVMITTASTQGISFRSSARVLYEDPAPGSTSDSASAPSP